MPTYEYACDPCSTIFKAMHRISERGPSHCPECGKGLRRILSAPSLNIGNFSSPTQAKYAKLSVSDEVAIESERQRVYRTIWMPEEVKHSPWDEHH